MRSRQDGLGFESRQELLGIGEASSWVREPLSYPTSQDAPTLDAYGSEEPEESEGAGVEGSCFLFLSFSSLSLSSLCLCVSVVHFLRALSGWTKTGIGSGR